MLHHSFLQLQGIGPVAERKLWSNGVTHWDDVSEESVAGMGPAKKKVLLEGSENSRLALEQRNHEHFSSGMASSEHWRMFPHFRQRTAYLDIETTGLEYPQAHITTIAIWDGSDIKHYVRGKNLDDFVKDITEYDMLVTYNGKRFDVPFIQSEFCITLPQAHIDLCHVLRSLGYKGGLKGCENQLGLNRGDLDGVDGFFAVLLWQEYINNKNPKALETLLAYNIEDVVNLEALMIIAYNQKVAKTPFGDDLEISDPARPEIPFKPHRSTINKLKSLHQVYAY